MDGIQEYGEKIAVDENVETKYTRRENIRRENIKRENMEQLADYRAYLQKHPKLAYLFIELTNRCNMRCTHCGSWCSPENSQNIDVDAVYETLKSVKARYKSAHTMICLTGGEPLMHPSFGRVAKMLKTLGFPWGMTSNGLLIDEAMAAFLKENGMGSITLSLDGVTKTHDAFRKVPGAFKKTLKAVDALNHSGMKVQVTTVVTKQNIGELDDICAVLKAHHTASWRLVNIEPIGRALAHPELMLAAEDYRYLLDYIREKRFDPSETMDVTFGCSHYLPEAYEHMVRDYYFICGSGIYVGSILCNGDIYSCLDIKRYPALVQGNIFKDDFCDIWENRFEVFREDRSEKCKVCRECTERAYCLGDSAHTWDYENNEPLLCLHRMLGA